MSRPAPFTQRAQPGLSQARSEGPIGMLVKEGRHFVGSHLPFRSLAGRYRCAGQFLTTLSHLVAAGLSLPIAMRHAVGAAGSAKFEKGVLRTADAIEEGECPNDAWRHSGLPEFAVATVVGNRTAIKSPYRFAHIARPAASVTNAFGVSRCAFQYASFGLSSSFALSVVMPRATASSE